MEGMGSLSVILRILQVAFLGSSHGYYRVGIWLMGCLGLPSVRYTFRLTFFLGAPSYERGEVVGGWVCLWRGYLGGGGGLGMCVRVGWVGL